MLKFNSKQELINAKAERSTEVVMEDGEGNREKIKEIEIQAAMKQIRWMNTYEANTFKKGAKGGYMIAGFGFYTVS